MVRKRIKPCMKVLLPTVRYKRKNAKKTFSLLLKHEESCALTIKVRKLNCV